VFCTSNWDQASGYGNDMYIIVPKDAKLYASKKISDLYEEIMLPIKILNKKYPTKELADFIKNLSYDADKVRDLTIPEQNKFWLEIFPSIAKKMVEGYQEYSLANYPHSVEVMLVCSEYYFINVDDLDTQSNTYKDILESGELLK
jgi:hypothetical protein